MTAIEIAEILRENAEWDYVLCEELCELADMTSDWEAADADTFETVLSAAADKLGVEIY